MRKGDLFEWLAGAGLVVTAVLAVCDVKFWVPVLVASLFLGAQALTADGTISFPKLKSKRPLASVTKFPRRQGVRMITTREEAWDTGKPGRP